MMGVEALHTSVSTVCCCVVLCLELSQRPLPLFFLLIRTVTAVTFGSGVVG